MPPLLLALLNVMVLIRAPVVVADTSSLGMFQQNTERLEKDLDFALKRIQELEKALLISAQSSRTCQGNNHTCSGSACTHDLRKKISTISSWGSETLQWCWNELIISWPLVDNIYGTATRKQKFNKTKIGGHVNLWNDFKSIEAVLSSISDCIHLRITTSKAALNQFRSQVITVLMTQPSIAIYAELIIDSVAYFVIMLSGMLLSQAVFSLLLSLSRRLGRILCCFCHCCRNLGDRKRSKKYGHRNRNRL